MRNREENLLHPSPELPPYLSLFHRHLDQLREHLSGTTRTDSCSPTIINGVEWEVSEKDAFFHALSVYSRLRPDLIAVSIGTKNEVEVLEYIASLEEALQENFQEDICRKKFPLAHEVSDSWIAWEEENAKRLQVNEEVWSAKAGGNTDDSKSSELSAHTDESSSKQPLSDIPYLTYGHLVVMDSILKADAKGAGKSTAIPAEEGTSSAQSITVVGSISPKRTLQFSASPTLNGFLGSLDKTIPISSEQDLNPSRDDPPNPQDMSPHSRRRHQKRMYMRRKRAQTSGGKVDKTTEKLRPGSRKKSARNRCRLATANIVEERGTESATAVDNAMSDLRDSGGDVDWISESENTEVGGDPPCMTPASRLPFQIARSELHDCHVNAGSIVAGGLDIFNHKKIGKLLQLFIAGYEPQLISEDASIKPELLFLLFEILKDFLVQTISRVIILEEEHHRLRGQTKVWRKNSDQVQNGLIDKSAIQFTLKTMGITNESIDQYFADLLGERFDTPPHQQTGFDDNERLVTGRNVFQQHPLQQDICPPHFHFFPASDAVDDKVEDLMHADTDDEGLDDILHEEEVLDEEEVLIDRTHEDTLWNEVPFPGKRTLSS